MDLWRKFGDMGLLGITCSSDYGGLDQGYLMHTIAMEGVYPFTCQDPATTFDGPLEGNKTDITTNYLCRNIKSIWFDSIVLWRSF